MVRIMPWAMQWHPRGQIVPYHTAITNIATIRGRYEIRARLGYGLISPNLQRTVRDHASELRQYLT